MIIQKDQWHCNICDTFALVDKSQSPKNWLLVGKACICPKCVKDIQRIAPFPIPDRNLCGGSENPCEVITF